MAEAPNLILCREKISTLDRARPAATALSVKDGLIAAVGDEAEVMPLAGPTTEVIDLGGRRVIPGLNDSHTHLIRGGLNYNMQYFRGMALLSRRTFHLRQRHGSQVRVLLGPPPIYLSEVWVSVLGEKRRESPGLHVPSLAESAFPPELPEYSWANIAGFSGAGNRLSR